MTQQPAVQPQFYTTSAQQQYAAHLYAATYPTPNIQSGPNYWAGAQSNFHAAPILLQIFGVDQTIKQGLCQMCKPSP